MFLNMKKNVQKSKGQRRISPMMAFLLTFSLVVLVGLGGMLLHTRGRAAEKSALPGESNFSENHSRKNTAEDAGFHFFWEAVPESVETIAPRKETGRYRDVLADPEYMAAENIYAISNRKEGIVTLGFAGDILFDDEYAIMVNLLNRGGAIENGISEALLSQMQGVDIMMLNNEFPYTERGTALEDKTYTFRADRSTVNYLADMGVDIVSLANNHMYDFGEIGLLDTLDTLRGAGIPYVGAGRNLEEAAAPVYFIAGDMKIAIVSATQIERLDNPDTKGATENSAGVFRCLNPGKLYEVVAEADANSDFVVVYIHWGTENVSEPDWAQLDQAPKLAEAGADLIIGDHSHCLQGFEYYGDVPAIYSLGNFWFSSRTLDTCMLQVDISQEGIEELRFVPAIQQDSRTDLAYDTEKERIISYMQEISFGVSIDSDGRVSKE